VFTLLKLFGFSKALGVNWSELSRSKDIEETPIRDVVDKMTGPEMDQIFELMQSWLSLVNPKSAAEAYCLLLLAKKIRKDWRWRGLGTKPIKPERLDYGPF
jgi:hypothetical protein